MQLGIHVVEFTVPDVPAGIAPELRRVAASVEAAGLADLSVMDHWFQMDMMAPADDPMMEGYSTLAFLAAHTESVRLGLLVTGVTYRHPGLLAKTVTTLDVLSEGRAQLGIGAAWYEREHKALGVPYPPTAERFERLEETLQVCLQMWDPADNGPYEGRHYQLAETLCCRRPCRRPGRRSSSGAAASGRPCGWWPSTRTPATCSAPRRPSCPTSSTSCAGTATTWAATWPTSASRSSTGAPAWPPGETDLLVSQLSDMAKVGVQEAIVVPPGDRPAAWIDEVVAPAVGPAVRVVGG